MNIKKGDKVIIMAGKDRGKTGTILKSFPKESRVIVEGHNKLKKHQKANRNAKGAIIDIAHPMHVSNVMLVGSNGKGTRTGKKLVGDKYVRVAKKGDREI